MEAGRRRVRCLCGAAMLALAVLVSDAHARAAICADAAGIQRAREAIETACGCPSSRRSAFLECARHALAATAYEKPCERAALRAVGRSLCGRREAAVVCCEARGRRLGRVVRSAKKCRGGEVCAVASRTPAGRVTPLFFSSVDDLCTQQATCRTSRVAHAMDPAMVPSMAALPGLDDGSPRPVAMAVGPDGRTEEFVADEVVLRPGSADELRAFLDRYGGTVLRDGTSRLAAGAQPAPGVPASSGWYLIRIDPSRSSLDDLDANLTAAGAAGRWSFSSEEGARIVALAAREVAREASPNVVAQLDQAVVSEHPDNGGGNLNAATWWWMTEDDAPGTPGDQGLSVGVVHAWEYVKYKGYPPTGPFTPVRVAVIDTGFDLDPTTGAPVGGNTDYPLAPLQFDEVGGDWTAGGPGSGFSNCNGCWHGQTTFGACCARARNGFGSAGTSGGWEVTPLLIRVDGDLYTIATAIYDALYNDALVINMSISQECGWVCRTFASGNVLKAAVGSARVQGSIVVASAGNQGQDISDVDRYPCSLNGAVCVGAIGWSGLAESYSNYGSIVDTWAPACFRSTVTRDSAAQDANATGEDELETFCGTSASSPYVAGIVALMKMLDPLVSYEQVRSYLRDTANPSADPEVSAMGYVDAYRVVAAVKPNEPPTVTVTSPAGGASVGYENVELAADVNDPETPSPLWGTVDFSSRLVFSSDLDGPLCAATGDATGGGTSLRCTAPHLRLGTHVITATATDPFGATGSGSVTVTVANRNPIAILEYPADGATYYSSQTINLRGNAYDPDESISDAQLEWWTMLESPVWQIWVLRGTGRSLWVSLPLGANRVQLLARDSLGATGSATIRVVVQEGAGYPTAHIESPADKAIFGLGTTITLIGSATDPEEGDLPDSALEWFSDIDGPLGSGKTIQVQLSGSTCNTIPHVVTLRATDSDGHQGTHSITVVVMNLC